MDITRFLPHDRLPPRPGLVAGAFFCALPLIFIPSLADPAEAPRWALLSALPFVACFVPSRFTSGHALGVAFLSWAAITLAWSSGPYEGANALWKLVCLAALFRIGSALPDLRAVFIGAGLAFAVNGAIVVAQAHGWEGVPQLQLPGGLFMNKNFVAEPAALVLVGLLAYRVWWLAPLVLPCLAFTTARGALLALGVALAAAIWPRSRVMAALLILCLAGGGWLWWQARTYNDTGSARLIIWSATVSDMTPLGRGLGSFYGRFPAAAPAYDTLNDRPSHAHNDLLEVAYETGIIGIVLAVGFLAFCLAGAGGPERLVLVAFLAIACLSFPTWFAVPAAMAAVCAGRLCGDRPHLRFHLALGRIRLHALAQRIEWD